jgi:hypothetical protein
MFSFLQEHNSWILAVFAAYVALLFVFASVYLLIHRGFPESFAFNVDVLRSQDAAYRSMKVKESEQNRPWISALEAMEIDLDGAEPKMTFTDNPTGVSIRSCAGYEASVRVRRTYQSPAMAKRKKSPLYMSQTWKEISVRHPNGGDQLPDRILRASDAVPKNVEEFRKLLARILQELLAEADSELDAATSPMPSPRMWSFWDFLYFSTITQSTVGYGDILPNSTLVRMVVTLQVVCSCAIAVVFVNLAVSHH